MVERPEPADGNRLTRRICTRNKRGVLQRQRANFQQISIYLHWPAALMLGHDLALVTINRQQCL
jgi:hypothetical protein